MDDLKVSLPPGSVLLFEDESDVDLNPTIEKAWGLQGEQPKVLAAGQNRRRSIFVAVDYVTHAVTHLIRERKCSADFLAYLEHLTTVYPWQQIYLVLDNGPCHTTKLVARTIAQRWPRLHLVFLPTYSPNLNVIEPFWRYLKRRVMANHFHGNVEQMVAAVERFFAEYAQGRITAFQFAA